MVKKLKDYYFFLNFLYRGKFFSEKKVLFFQKGIRVFILFEFIHM